MTPQELQLIADQAGASIGLIESWYDDLKVIYADCLDTLDTAKKNLALKYLILHFASNSGGQAVTSYRLGDESWGYKDAGQGMNATSYGRLAVSIAPCLASADVGRRYGTVRLLR